MTMTHRTLQALTLGLFLAPAAGAHELAGSVRTADGRPLSGARVTAESAEARSDDRGFFRLDVPAGHHVLQASRDGHNPASLDVEVAGDLRDLEIRLTPVYRVSEEVVVQAVRADERAPITRRDLGAEELGQLNHGQEMPVLLQQTPSINQYSDAGNGTGYSYIYLRGIQQTRINITLDGAPLNEAEDGALYFADFGDFASALGSIQVQRGVGTSTVGSAAYAGSINFASLDLSARPAADGRLTAGSFGTQRAGLGLHSGKLGAFELFARGAYQESDGFRERSGVRQRSLFYGATHQDERSFFKVFGFAGTENTHLAFYAVEPAVLEQDLRSNPLSPEETDAFGQRFVHVQYTRALGAGQSLTVQGYRNSAGGSYRLWDSPEHGALLEYGLDWVNWGGQAAYRRAWGHSSLTWGAHAYHFASHHLQDVVDGGRNYANQGFKTEGSSFVKLTHDSGRLHLYGDAQLRFARFSYDGSVALGSVDWTFFNPKLGARWDLSSQWSTYLSVGRGNREPGRSDLLSGEDNASIPYDLTAVHPEHVMDFEAGLELHRPGLSVQANVFTMEFRDEIALTGELSQIGYALRRNVDRSFRRGLELDATWEPVRGLRLTHASSLTWGRIADWTQFYDVYDADFAYQGSTSRSFHDVAPLLTPAVLVNQGIEWRPRQFALLSATGRYVGKGWLDNTNTPGIETPDFFDLGLAAVLDLSRWTRHGAPKLRVQVDNVLDGKRHWPSGYSYLFAVRGPDGHDDFQGTPYFYPLATRAVLVSLDFAF